MSKALIEIVSGRAGPSLYVCDKSSGQRVAGPKPWGGGSLLHSFEVDADEMIQALKQYSLRYKTPADLKAADRVSLELAAEVARYRAAMQSIVDKCSDGNECDAEKVNQDCRRIARNALKDGV